MLAANALDKIAREKGVPLLSAFMMFPEIEAAHLTEGQVLERKDLNLVPPTAETRFFLS